MHKEFLPYQQALELKELGFDEPCFGWFILEGDGAKSMFVPEKCPKQDIGLCLAPTFSQCFRFFREKYGLKISFTYWNGYNGFITRGAYKYECYIIPENDMSITVRGEKGNVYFNTYEEAELACLKKLIEIIKTKQNG